MNKTSKKIGFFSALSIVVGSIVGIGIFFKNGGVGAIVEGDGVTWLFAWLLSGLVALMVAFHFGKISKTESKKYCGVGMTNWSQTVVKKTNWFSHLTSFNYGFFYLAILSLSLSFFASETLISFLETVASIKINFYWNILVSIFFIFIFVITNLFSVKTSGYISLTTTVLKFVPILITVIIGISFLDTRNLEIVSNNNNVEDTLVSSNGFLIKTNPFDAFKNLTIALPSILFAFDAFTGIGSYRKSIKNSEKNISKVIVLGMIIVIVIYTLVTLASIFHYFEDGKTTIENVILDSLNGNVAKGISIFVSLFIFISIYGTCNSITGAWINELSNAVKTKRYFFANIFLKKFKEKKAIYFTIFSCFLFWWLVMIIPSIIIGSDSLVEGISNFPTLFFFCIYAFMIFFYWKNHYSKEQHPIKWKKYAYTSMVFISIVAVLLVVGINFLMLVINAIDNPTESTKWGLFHGGKIVLWNEIVIYLSILSIFILAPYFNRKLIEKFENRDHFKSVDIWYNIKENKYIKKGFWL